jgi:hypothetical protein
MVEKVVNPDRRNIIDLANYQRAQPTAAQPVGTRWCRHCGAALLDDESEDDCSSAGLFLQAPARARSPRRFRAE